jgi:hypothetical protein
MTTLKYLICLLLLLALFSSCTRPNKEKEDLGSICFNEGWNLDSIAQFKEYKLVYVFDGNCSLCIMKLLKWQSLIESNFNEFSIYPVFIAEKSDYDILSYNLEKVNFKYQVIFDSLSVFQTKNKPLNIMYNDFFLLDKENNILMRSNSIPESILKNYLMQPKNE